MKKKILTIVFLSLSIILYSQNIDKIKFERNYSNIVLTQTSLLNLEQGKGSESKENIDSLKVIDRKSLLKKLKGTWRLVKYQCDHCVIRKKDDLIPKKFIKISKTKLKFYDDEVNRKNLKNSEELIFTEQFSIYSDLTNLVFKDKTTWSFETDAKRKFLKIYKTGKENENGRTVKISGFFIEYYEKIK